jgi:hypothetical protein
MARISQRTFFAFTHCHLLLDEFTLWISDDHKLGGRDGLLRVDPKHAVSSEFLQYHRRMCGH